MNLNKILTVKRALVFVTACSVALAAECVWLGRQLDDARDDVAVLKQMIAQAKAQRGPGITNLPSNSGYVLFDRYITSNITSPVARRVVEPFDGKYILQTNQVRFTNFLADEGYDLREKVVNTSPVAPYLVRPAATMKGTN